MFVDEQASTAIDDGGRRVQPPWTDPAAAFLHRLTENHDVADTEFLTDAGGYLTALVRLDLRGGLNYSERNSIEKWFQTVVMRIDRFHLFWWGSPARAGAGCDGSGITTTRPTEPSARRTNAR